MNRISLWRLKHSHPVSGRPDADESKWTESRSGDWNTLVLKRIHKGTIGLNEQNLALEIETSAPPDRSAVIVVGLNEQNLALEIETTRYRKS